MRVRHQTLPIFLAIVSAAACESTSTQDLRSVPRGAYTVTINQPAKLTSVEAGQRDALGRIRRVPCATCHTILDRDAGSLASAAGDLRDFHRGLRFSHGSVSCASCHVRGPRVSEELRLADGTTVPMTEVMQLCAQCHGPQYRDYRHGSHGGMTGYWDLRREAWGRLSAVGCG